MTPLEQCKPNWTAIGVIGGFIINISGWFIVHFLTKCREAQKEQRARDLAGKDATQAREEDQIARDKKQFLLGIDATLEAIKTRDSRQRERLHNLETPYLTFKPHFKGKCLEAKTYEDTWQKLRSIQPVITTAMSREDLNKELSRVQNTTIATLEKLRELVENR